MRAWAGSHRCTRPRERPELRIREAGDAFRPEYGHGPQNGLRHAGTPLTPVRTAPPAARGCARQLTERVPSWGVPSSSSRAEDMRLLRLGTQERLVFLECLTNQTALPDQP